MAFAINNYAKVWTIYDGELKKARISTSRKNSEGNYSQDFSGFATFFSDAANKFDELEEDDTIKILACSVTTKYSKKEDVNYTNYNIFDFEIQDKKSKKKARR